MRRLRNGRIDLLQAESVIDIINAKSEKEAKAGINQLEGQLSKSIHEIKQMIMDVMVNVEVTIDYPEYDVDEITINQIYEMLEKVKGRLMTLEKSFDNGKIIKNGIKTAIIGKPNAGKSSLLNRILNEDRAIVTDIEGTTRDSIEEFVNVNGIPLKLIDTAGIRNAKDEVERIGIEKSREIAESADLVIAIIDSSKEFSDEDKEILEIVKDKKSIIVLNKIDLEQKISKADDRLKLFENNIIEISTIENKGLDELYEKISELFNLNEINFDNEILITNIRHKNLISDTINSLEKTEETIRQNMPLDIIAIFLKDILSNLGKITGEEISEDIINEIFAKFCLGK